MELKLIDGTEAVLTRYDARKNKSGRVTPESFDGFTLPFFTPLTAKQKQELIDLFGMHLELKLLVLDMDTGQNETLIKMHSLRRNSGN